MIRFFIVCSYVMVLSAALSGCMASPIAAEAWTLSQVLTVDSRQDSVTDTVDVHNCDVPETGKQISCSAGTESSVTVDVGAGIPIQVVVDFGVQGQIGIGKNSGTSIQLEMPPEGHVYRYIFEKTYTAVTGKGVVVSTQGERREGDYVFNASCTLTLLSRDMLSCREAGGGRTNQPALAAMLETLSQLYNAGDTLDWVAFDNNSQRWTILHGDNGAYIGFAAEEVRQAVQRAYEQQQPVKQIILGPNGAWLVLYGANGFSGSGLPDALGQKILELNQQGADIDHVAITDDADWLVIYNGNAFHGYGMPSKLIETLQYLYEHDRKIKQVAISPKGYWVVLYDRNNVWYRQIPDDLKELLADLEDQQTEIRQVIFLDDAGWLVLFGQGSYEYTR